ncbi:MAG: biotin--[acetyl-CoA-carboxylase] ligase [Spirosomaceae bacterium]|nr:biotin--[acetyl-CoA-carboxylase] ligase [Spirosomataceae bacterium]
MYNIQPKTLFVGKNTIYLPSCHSTNTFAAELIQNSEILDGTIVITSNQTAGRGQRGNSWETIPGQNITASFILKPKFLTATEQFKLNIAVSLGVHEFLEKYLPNDLKVKWPNDIYVANRKLGGILIENSLSGSRIGCSIVGIGLNINQLGFAEPKAISLRMAAPNDEYDIEKLVEELAQSLEKNYLELKAGFANRQKERYLRILFRYQEKHFFEQGNERFSGQIMGVADSGCLIVEVNGELKYFDFKEIKFVI